MPEGDTIMMDKDDLTGSRVPTLEPTETPEAELPPVSPAASKERPYQVEGVRAIDEQELSTVARRFLIAEINRLVEENQQLKQFKEKYHDVDKRLAVLKETLKPFRTNEFLSSVCLATGAAGLGAAPSFLSLNLYGWYVFVAVSGVLIVAGIAAKVRGPSTATTARH
jgi:hypothetical protein